MISRLLVVFALWVACLASDGSCLSEDLRDVVYSAQPAAKWQEALVTGNGAMGVLVFGDPANERVVFNHERLYEPLYDQPVPPPKVSHVLPEVRRLALAGEFVEARRVFATACREAGYNELLWTDPYHPAMAMRITQPVSVSEVFGDKPSGDYRRTCDLRTGEVAVQWDNDAGAFERLTFVSRTEDVVVQRLRRSDAEGVISATISLENQDRRPAKEQSASYHPPVIEASKDWLTYRCKYRKSKRGYFSVTRVVPLDGEAAESDGAESDSKVEFIGRELLLLTRVVSVEDWVDQEQLEAETKRELAALPADYDALLSPHAAEHSAIYSRMVIDLGGDALRGASTEELIATQKASDRIVPELLEKMFNMGRYSFICSSGEWPPNLMGIFNGDWRPDWSGDFTLDANVNLQIAPAVIGAMPEGIDSYANLIEGIADDWRVNARNLYGCRGLLSGCRTDGRHNLHTHHVLEKYFGGFFWTAGAEWLVLPLYEHYQATGDEQFARQRLLPLMKGVVDFYEDFLVEQDSNGKFVFVPSYSPENSPANTKNQLTINASMDIACAKEACHNLIALCRDLGGEDETIEQCQRLLVGLPPYLVNEDGALKEWAWPSLDDHYDHRHVSHLYPVWPGHEITPEDTPELFDAAVVAARKRGRGNGSAHGLSHMALIGARLKDAELVHGNLRFMLSQDYLLPSLFTYHNPGRIYNADMLHSLPAVVIEMLVYSKPGEIELLPALSDGLAQGEITGVGCRCQTTVDKLRWDLNQREVEVTLQSNTNQTLTLRLRRGIAAIEGEGAQPLATKDGHTVNLRLKADQPATFKLTLAE